MEKDFKKYYGDILAVSESIRFVGTIDFQGDILSQSKRFGIKELVENGMLQSLYSFTTSMNLHFKDYKDKLGELKWNVACLDKVNLITVIQNESMLIISTESDADPLKIINNVKKIMKNY